jgi:ribose transport system substrate-binding protein
MPPTPSTRVAWRRHCERHRMQVSRTRQVNDAFVTKAQEEVRLMGLRTRTGSRIGGSRFAIAAMLLALLAFVAAGCGSDNNSSSSSGGSSTGSASSGGKKYKIGVSNTLVGNGWREEMICAVKAQAAASGKVSDVVVSNQNGGAPEQIAAMRNLISSGVNAIIVNPADPNALNPVIKEAKRRGIVVVSVDSAVTAPEAYVVTNDQVAYGRLGGEWLAKAMGGKGDVVEMRGIKGVPADTDRHKGFMEALSKYPDIKVVKETFTNWSFAPGGKQALDILNSGTKVDGIWTSGIDYTVVNAFTTAKKPYVPVVGADNNKFLEQMKDLESKGFKGAAVTNPAAIGGVGTAIALDALEGKNPPHKTTLTPQVWDMATAKDKIEQFYDASLPPTYSSQMLVEPYTTYSQDQLKQCQGPSA